jgi:hypothetical protein
MIKQQRVRGLHAREGHHNSSHREQMEEFEDNEENYDDDIQENIDVYSSNEVHIYCI